MAKARKYHHGNLKVALIEAGLAILSESGLAALSLRSCAERVGVSHTASNNHFGNLEGLRTAIAARGYEKLKHYMQRRLPTDSNIMQRQDALKGYVAFAIDNPSLFELMFSRQQVNSDDPELFRRISACFSILSDISQDLDWRQSSGADRELKDKMMLWSLVHGFASLTVNGNFRKKEMKKLGILDIVPNAQASDTD